MIMLVIGVGLFLLPAQAAPLWPWPLTPLTARMIGAFYLAFAVSLFAAAKEDDYGRVLVATAAYVVFAVLQFANFIRYPIMDWGRQQVWLLAGAMAALFVVAAFLFVFNDSHFLASANF